MTLKLTLAQMEALYSAYKAHREGKAWDVQRFLKTTRIALQKRGLITFLTGKFAWEFAPDKGLPLADELDFPARYEAEKQETAARQQSDAEQQAAYRKLLEIPDTIAAPHIVDNVNKWVGVHYWTIHFSKGITIRGRVSADDDSVAYRIDINNVRLETTADITAFQREMFAAFNLFTRLQRDLKGKVPTYEPSARAILPGKGIGEQS